MAGQAPYDVAIVGASIAGCTAATLFGQQGLRVALLDRSPDMNAYKRLCTHYIQPSAAPAIKRLGLAEPIEAAGGIRNGVEIWTRWGWIRDTLNEKQGQPAYGYNIRRETLDPMLRALAARTPGVDLLLGHSVRGLLRAGGRVAGVVARDVDGNARELRARLVVGADGRNSRTAELAGVHAQVKPHNRFGYFAYYRNMPLASGTTSQAWLLEPDVVYTFPNEDGVTIAACMPGKERLPEFRADLEGAYLRMFDGLPRGPKVREAERISPILGMIDMPNISRRATKPGLALIGDAALASDPLWGVGCGWAFQSGEWLADATEGAFGSPAELDTALTRYAKRHHAALAGHHYLIADFATGRPYNPLERLLFSAAAKDPVSAHHLAAFAGRTIGVREFLEPRALARAAWINLNQGRGGRHQTNPALMRAAS
jgi:2-polyprenyl-6-methoxyphenol hydroxylase-like FAD-dependent oxidoreductase